MSPKHQLVWTFQQVREQGEKGSAAAWRAFLGLYLPFCLHLLTVYSPADPSSGVLRKFLEVLTIDDFARFRGTERQSEREFLTDLRALLLDTMLEEANAAGVSLSASDAERFSSQAIGKLIDGLPLAHQEMVFFRLSGYGDAAMEAMLRITPRVAQPAFARLEPGYAAPISATEDRCPWPVAWLTLQRHARAAKQENCPPLHQFVRIQDGQVSWYDKEPLEKHVTGCLRCLERWAALRECGYWRHKAKPVSASEIEAYLKGIPTAAEQKTPLLKRVFGP